MEPISDFPIMSADEPTQPSDRTSQNLEDGLWPAEQWPSAQRIVRGESGFPSPHRAPGNPLYGFSSGEQRLEQNEAAVLPEGGDMEQEANDFYETSQPADYEPGLAATHGPMNATSDVVEMARPEDLGEEERPGGKPDHRVRRRRRSSRGAAPHPPAQHQTSRRGRRSITSRWWFIVLSIVLVLAGCVWFALELRQRDIAGALGKRGVAAAAAIEKGEDPLAEPALPNYKKREEAAELIDKALIARRDADSETALALLDEVREKHPWVQGLALEAALIHISEGQNAEALAVANNAVREWRDLEAAHTAIGLLAQQEQKLEAAVLSFRDAHLADPFDPDPLFYWSEALRKLGRSREAVEKLEAALVRTLSESSQFLFQCKKDLAEMELDPARATKLADETVADLNAPSNMALAAAAVKLQAGDVQAARELLGRCAVRMPRTFFLFLLGDPAFATLGNHPELIDVVRELVGAGTPPPPEASP